MGSEDYVCGFLFNNNKNRIILIEKKRPDWQKGKLNGVGGHIEARETTFGAMVREFEEETGVKLHEWIAFAVLSDMRNYTVYFFVAFNDDAFHSVKSITDEKIVKIKVADIGKKNIIPNLNWLIPMALTKEKEPSVLRFEITEIPYYKGE